MQIVIMSDNHTKRVPLKKIFDYYRDQPDTKFVHCGDSEFDSCDDPIFEGCYRVRGNCDNSSFPEVVTFEEGGISFLVTHGHCQWVGSGVDRLATLARESGARIAFYGHTHKLAEETDKGVLCINSGSVSEPRGHFWMTPSYAVLTIDSPHKVSLTFYTMAHEPIEGLHYVYHDEEGSGFTHD